MSSWFKQFGLHLAAAIGATGIFVAAAAVGANQASQQLSAATQTVAQAPGRPSPGAQRKPAGVVASPSATSDQPLTATPGPTKVVPERSLSGTIRNVLGDGLDIVGVGGREWRVTPNPGALIRLNGKNTPLGGLQVGDTVVVLGQAQPGPGNRFLAHAITARRK